MQRLEHVIRDARAHHGKEDGGRYRHPQRHDGFVHVVDGSPVLDRIHDHARHARQDAIDDEAGCVGDEDGTFAQLRTDLERGRQ